MAITSLTDKTDHEPPPLILPPRSVRLSIIRDAFKLDRQLTHDVDDAGRWIRTTDIRPSWNHRPRLRLLIKDWQMLAIMFVAQMLVISFFAASSIASYASCRELIVVAIALVIFAMVWAQQLPLSNHGTSAITAVCPPCRYILAATPSHLR
jgi:hypothetical protein